MPLEPDVAKKPEQASKRCLASSSIACHGTIGFDANDDVTGHDIFAWYGWQDGDCVPSEAE